MQSALINIRKRNEIVLSKIGIVTWYDKGYNYGSTLQAFAMQSYLENKGYECELINYKPEYKKVYNVLKEIIKRLYLLVFNYKVYKSWRIMEKWIKNNIKESKLILSYEELIKYSQKYDILICGSDQIWCNSHDVVDPFYYLQFTDIEKRIAYAPSIGKNYINDNIQETFAKYVKEIKYLSIREEKGAELIQKYAGKSAKVVVDPTFLLDKKMWEKSAKISKNRIINEPYIFAYFLKKNEEYFEQVNEIAKKKNLRIITVPIMNNNNKLAIEVNHTDFLNLIKNAKYVITDSFHGMVFSINFEKDFIIYKKFNDNLKETENSRIYNILEKLNLYNRLVTDNNTIDNIIDTNINYSEVKKKLNKLINESEKYLTESIDCVIKK